MPGIVFRTEPGEVTHAELIRCPYCRHVGRSDEYERAGDVEDGADVWCSACGKEFHVGTRITYRYTSPPLESEADDE